MLSFAYKTDIFTKIKMAALYWRDCKKMGLPSQLLLMELKIDGTANFSREQFGCRYQKF